MKKSFHWKIPKSIILLKVICLENLVFENNLNKTCVACDIQSITFLEQKKLESWED